MNYAKSGLRRGEDGILLYVGGIGTSYHDPKEAVKTSWNGKLTCTERVWGTWDAAPCGKTPKHDHDNNGQPTKCGIHCKAAVEKRQAKSDEKMNHWRRQMDARSALSEATNAVEKALRKIAQGHNDPRGLATEVIDTLDAAREASRLAHQKDTKP